MRHAILLLSLAALWMGCTPEPPPESVVSARPSFAPGQRTLLHAHNCYPYNGEHTDRIDRALAAATPVIIEQDVIWHEGRSIVGHECPCSGQEPSLEEHFFERVKPMIEQALANPEPAKWPLVVLHLDFKTEEPEHLAAVNALLEKYRAWLTTAPKTATPEKEEPWRMGPVLALTEASPAKEKAFNGDVPVGGELRIFGSLPPSDAPMSTEPAPAEMLAGGPSNYRRWWNLSWHAVEAGGQTKAGEWTPEDEARLKALVEYGHGLGVFVRFYCLNGHPADDPHGWSPGYNFGSLEAAQTRWRAAKAAGVDWLATDQYEDLAAELR